MAVRSDPGSLLLQSKMTNMELMAHLLILQTKKFSIDLVRKAQIFMLRTSVKENHTDTSGSRVQIHTRANSAKRRTTIGKKIKMMFGSSMVIFTNVLVI